MGRKEKKKDQRPAYFRIAMIVVFILVAANYAWYRLGNDDDGTAGKASLLAECLTARGAKLYGTYWCAHCTSQKKRFGEAFSEVDYVECAVRGKPREQTEECQEAGIAVFPTWVFADGSRVSGDQNLSSLAEVSGCTDVWTATGSEELRAPEDGGPPEAEG